MKRMIRWMLLLAMVSFHVNRGTAQGRGKRVIDSTVFGRWPSVNGGVFLSGDGKYVRYQLKNVPVGGGSLVLQSTEGLWKRVLPGVSWGDFSADSRWVVCRGAHDSVWLVALGGQERKCLSGVSSYRLGGDSHAPYLAWLSKTRELKLEALGAEGGEVKKGVSNFSFSPDGRLLIWQVGEDKDSGREQQVYVRDMGSGHEEVIWEGEGRAGEYAFDTAGHQLALVVTGRGPAAAHRIYWWRGEGKAREVAGGHPAGVDSGLEVKGGLQFSGDGERLFFRLGPAGNPGEAKSSASRSGPGVNIWDYRDVVLQSEQQLRPNLAVQYLASVTAEGRVVQLEGAGMQLYIAGLEQTANRYIILLANDGWLESWWRRGERPSVYLEDTRDGSRRLLSDSLVYRYTQQTGYVLSPGEGYVVHYDPVGGDYWSDETGTGVRHNLTRGMGVTWRDTLGDRPVPYWSIPVGIAGILGGDRGLLVYDPHDLWLLDLSGRRRGEDITKGYGRTHHLRLRVLGTSQYPRNLVMGDTLLLTGFNEETKETGFYRQVLGSKEGPERLSQSGCWQVMERGTKAGGGTWIVKRERAEESPNYYVTHDFRSFRALSELYPERDYNWLRSELVRWRLPDGRWSQGILYFPEDFDVHRKYPLLLNYYERKSDELHRYREPGPTESNINIPYFVSRGYLVFLPDIHYRTGHTGEGALAAIVSAARYLSGKPWVDGSRMGIDGHSFGGFETNYVVTHSHLFAAAAEAAGQTDFISGYGGLRGQGSSREFLYEIDQDRMRSTLWEHPEWYLENSAVLRADRVTTPLLMMHNKEDGSVPFGQALELYLALRRLGKRAWLLDYDGMGHSLGGDKAPLDYTLRLEQFFDYYLKGALPPRWMTEGIPFSRKGTDNGYEPDSSGKSPE